MKVSVLGAAGGIGQPMALLMKLNPLISHLALYDIVHTPGVAADVSHCATPAQVSGHLGPQQLKDALEGSHVAVIPAGVPRKPGYELIADGTMWLINEQTAICIELTAVDCCHSTLYVGTSEPANGRLHVVEKNFFIMSLISFVLLLYFYVYCT